MPGKVAVMDNAGIVSRLIDKSQVAGNLSPNALYGAFAINANKGFMNQIYRLTNGVYDRVRYFGAKDWRTRGRSLHDLDKYLESSQPAYAVRAGYIDPNSGLISEHNKLAAIDFYPYPKSAGNYAVNLFDRDGDALVSTTDADGVGKYSVSLAREDKDSPEVEVYVDIRNSKATVELSDMGLFDKQSLTVTKLSEPYLLSESYTFDKNMIKIGGLTVCEKPELVEFAYRLRGVDSNGNSATYPLRGSLAYDPAPYLYGDVDRRTWIIQKSEYNESTIDTGLVFLKEQDKPTIEEIRKVTYTLTGRSVDDGEQISYPAHGALLNDPTQHLVGDVNSRTWWVKDANSSVKSLNTGLTYLTETAKPEVKRVDGVEYKDVPLYVLKGVNASGKPVNYPLSGFLEYDPMPRLFGSPDSRTWVIQVTDDPVSYVDTGLVFLMKQEKPTLQSFKDVTYKLRGIDSDGELATYPLDRALSYDPTSYLVGDENTHTWIIQKAGAEEDTGLIFSIVQEKPSVVTFDEVKEVTTPYYRLKGVDIDGQDAVYPLNENLVYDPAQYLQRNTNTHTWIIGANEHTGKDINTKLISSVVQDTPSVEEVIDPEGTLLGYRIHGMDENNEPIVFPESEYLDFDPTDYLEEIEEGIWALVVEPADGEDEEEVEIQLHRVGNNDTWLGEAPGGVISIFRHISTGEWLFSIHSGPQLPVSELTAHGLHVQIEEGVPRLFIQNTHVWCIFVGEPNVERVTEPLLVGYRLHGVNVNGTAVCYPAVSAEPLTEDPTGLLAGDVSTATWKISPDGNPETDIDTGLLYLKYLDEPVVEVSEVVTSIPTVGYRLQGVDAKGKAAVYPSTGTLSYDPTDYLFENDNHVWVIGVNEHSNGVVTTGLFASVKQAKPSVSKFKDVTYKLQGIDDSGDTAEYPLANSAMSYNPTPYLFGCAKTRTWVIGANEHSDTNVNTGLAFLTENGIPTAEETQETRPVNVVSYYLKGVDAQGNQVTYPSSGDRGNRLDNLSFNPDLHLAGSNNSRTWIIKQNRHTEEDIDTGLQFLNEHSKPTVNTHEALTYRLKGVDSKGNATVFPVGGVLSYNPIQYVEGDDDTRTWWIEGNPHDSKPINTNLLFLAAQAKPTAEDVEGNEDRDTLGYKLKGVSNDGKTAFYPADKTLVYNPLPYLFSSVDTNAWVISENSHSSTHADTGLAYMIGTDPVVLKTGLINDSLNHLDNVGNVPSNSPDTESIPENFVIHGLRKRVQTDNGYDYVMLEQRDMRAIFAKSVSPGLAESMAVVISTVDDHITLGIGESVSFSVDGQREVLTMDKDETGYMQTSSTGYRQLEIDPRVFKDPKAIATIFAKGEGAWGNNIEITIAQKSFRFVESAAKGAVFVERMDNSGLPVLYRNINVKKDETKWVKNHNTADTWRGKDTDEGFFGRFAEEDGPRIFQIQVKDTLTGVYEYYQNVSFNPQDTDESGNSIYIENVLGRSDLVGVVVNEGIEDAGYEPQVNSKNVEILPVARTTDPNTPYIFAETKMLGGGRDLNVNTMPGTAVAGINTPSAMDDFWTPTNRSESFKNALNVILEAWPTHDSYLAFNAGQEILNPDFANLIASSNGGLPRVLGLTSVELGEAMAQDRLPADVPEGEGGPSGGVATPWVAKYNQWIFGTDGDAGQPIYTSPVGWIGKLIGINAINGMLPYAPAGYRRGILHGAFGLSRSWSPKQRLGVVEYKWNPIKYDPTAGYVVWDELTSQPIASALSNIHVILAYQAMRRGVEQTLKGFEFEFNDESTVNTMLNMLRGMANSYVSQKYAEEIIVDAAENEYGTDQIRIRWNTRFKEVARTIVVDIIAYPSSQELSVSMAG